jgi:GH35 family endo-1,4-beta-xylanase/FlaG/FlaF family flagellin (archaellin)
MLHKPHSRLCALLLIAAISIFSVSLQPVSSSAAAQSSTLRQLATQRGFRIGTAVNTYTLENNATYRDIVRTEFNAITAENDMKFDVLQPSEGSFNFSRADYMVQFAQQNNMEVHGHTLIWSAQNAQWVQTVYDNTPADQRRSRFLGIMENHIRTVLQHFGTNVKVWDVVNEPAWYDGTLADSIWKNAIGNDYVTRAFEYARRYASSGVKLMVNEYWIEGTGNGYSYQTKSDQLYNIVRDLKAANLIDAVGFQSHFVPSGGQYDFPSYPSPTIQQFKDNVQRYANLGVQVYITEMDTKVVTTEPNPPSQAQLTEQRNMYYDFVRACLEMSACVGFSVWGVDDGGSWLNSPYWGGKYTHPLLWDRNFQKKAAYFGVYDALAGSTTTPTNTPAPTFQPPTNTPTGNSGGNGSPYGGTAASIPGRVQAENYNTGGQGVAYSDNDSGNNGGEYRSDGVDIAGTGDAGGGHKIGWFDGGEWLKYTVNVTSAGTYELRLRVASEQSSGAFYVEVDGSNVTGTISAPNTGGWDTWQTITRSNISLSAGQHVIRIVNTSGWFDLNWFEFGGGVAPTNTPTGSGGNDGSPYGGSAVNLPGRIQAENYNTGGQGVAYSDNTSGNAGGQYRSDGVDIGGTSDTGSSHNVGWMEGGEWLKYTVNVTSAGTYDLDLRIASDQSSGILYVEVDGTNVTGNVNIPNTGGWGSWATLTKQNISLSAGQHVIRVVVVSGWFNLNWLEIN